MPTDKLNYLSDSNQHQPVLIAEICQHIQQNWKQTNNLKIFDGTFGGGGYSYNFLQLGAKVWSCDLDISVINNLTKALHSNQQLSYLQQQKNNGNLIIEHHNFTNYIDDFKDDFFDAVVLDLGYSSNQLEYSERGFSYLKSNELFDLRFDQNSGLSAYHKIANLPDSQILAKVIYQNSGQEFAYQIANNIYQSIIKNTKANQMVSVGQIVEAVKKSIPIKLRHKTNAILSRVWQAIRIWVNNEFENISNFLDISGNKIKPEGLIMIVNFHSLEDKLITNYFRKLAKPIVVDDFGNKITKFELLTKKAITPTPLEIDKNVRSRSASLRILKKLKTS